MKDLYLECYSGISGDMTVAALLDLGASLDKLKATLKELKHSNLEKATPQDIRKIFDA